MKIPIWIVIDEDRHVDVEVYVFSSREAALKKAEALTPKDYERPPLTEPMKRALWIYFASHPSEGDCVRVVRRELE